MWCYGKSFLLYFCYLLVGSLKISTYVLMQLTVTGHKSKKDLRKAFSGVFWGLTLAGLDPRCSSRCWRCTHPSSLVCTLSYCVATALLQCLEIPQDSRRSHWPAVVPVSSLSPCKRKTVFFFLSTASAAACRSRFLSRPTRVPAALLWRGQELPVVATTQH